MDLGWYDVYYRNWQGRGSYRDPLLCDPAAVVRDFAESKISLRAAREVYSVALDKTGGLDAAWTREMGRRLRLKRAGGREHPPLPIADAAGTEWSRIDRNVAIDPDNGCQRGKVRQGGWP